VVLVDQEGREVQEVQEYPVLPSYPLALELPVYLEDLQHLNLLQEDPGDQDHPFLLVVLDDLES